MSAAEDLAIHGMLWGDPDVLLAEIAAGRLVADHFMNPARRAAVEAVLAIVDVGFDPSPAAVHDHLVDVGGLRWHDAHNAVVLPGMFEPWTGQLWRLPAYLASVAEEHDRRERRADLVRLLDQVERPGGPARVARALGVAS